MRSAWKVLFAGLLAGCSFDPVDVAFDEALDAGRDAAVVPGDASAADLTPPTPDAAIEPDAGGPSADVSVADVPAVDDVGPDTGVDAGPPGPGVTVVDGRLTLVTQARGHVDDCAAAGQDPCDDLDQDDLVDRWEAEVLAAFQPLVVFDEEESALTDAGAVVLHVARVAPVRRRPLEVQAWITILYDRDYGTCGSLTAHNGDSERVVVTLQETAAGVRMTRAFTAAHENTVTDQSMSFEGGELRQLTLAEEAGVARWVVFASKDKHATYPSAAVCEGISPLPCFSEACGPAGARNPPLAQLLAIYNAGEPDAPLLTDLGPLGFPGEDAWADQAFCGGRDRRLTCPGSVRSKLLDDPF